MSFSYEAMHPVLNGITMDLTHSTIAIVGPSGCGKSTLLRLLSGVFRKSDYKYYNGEITLDSLAPEQYNQLGKTGFMFQEPTLFPNLNVRDNIALPLKLGKTKPMDHVTELMTLVGLEKYEQYLPHQLSGGMKSRVALARTFSTRPSLLLLDEPFSSMDIVRRVAMYQELKNLRERFQTTVIMVTHDIQEALEHFTHVIVLNKRGQVIRQIQNHECLDRYSSEFHSYYDIIRHMLITDDAA